MTNKTSLKLMEMPRKDLRELATRQAKLASMYEKAYIIALIELKIKDPQNHMFENLSDIHKEMVQKGAVYVKEMFG